MRFFVLLFCRKFLVCEMLKVFYVTISSRIRESLFWFAQSSVICQYRLRFGWFKFSNVMLIYKISNVFDDQQSMLGWGADAFFFFLRNHTPVFVTVSTLCNRSLLGYVSDSRTIFYSENHCISSSPPKNPQFPQVTTLVGDDEDILSYIH